jgi:RHS repeat-associated protein
MPFGFASAWRSPGTGLYYMRNRWYSAELGQFLSQDPLGYVDSFNPYAYVGFDPINGWDPFGLSTHGFTRGLPGAMGGLGPAVGTVSPVPGSPFAPIPWRAPGGLGGPGGGIRGPGLQGYDPTPFEPRAVPRPGVRPGPGFGFGLSVGLGFLAGFNDDGGGFIRERQRQSEMDRYVREKYIDPAIDREPRRDPPKPANHSIREPNPVDKYLAPGSSQSRVGEPPENPDPFSAAEPRPPTLEHTPTTHPGEFDPIKREKAKVQIETGEIWEKDMLHKNHFEVYKNRKTFEKGVRDRAVWEDGRLKETYK